MKKISGFFLTMMFVVLYPNYAIFGKSIQLNINTKNSLLRIGISPTTITNDGKQVANKFYDALDADDVSMMDIVSMDFDKIQKKESNSLDYSALKWLCDKLIEEKKRGKPIIGDKLSADYYKYFIDNKYANLKEYLSGHYKIKNYQQTEDNEEKNNRKTFLEDLLLFNDPSRSKWDYSDKVISLLDIKKGNKVLDLGAGFGYYSNKILDLVGETGKVYSVDTNSKYIDYLGVFAKTYNINNIIPVTSKENNVVVNEKVDAVFMSSLYHIIYGWSQEGNRNSLINSIKDILKPGGRVYIVDNKDFYGNQFNNCYIYKELIISQLQMYGFKYEKYYDISKKRYLLEFSFLPGEIQGLMVRDDGSSNDRNGKELEIKDQKSIIHIGSLDSYDTTQKGILGAKMVLNVLTNKKHDDAINAARYYESIIPSENFGGEYTALQWFCKYEGASLSARKEMLKDPLIKSYYEYLGTDDYKLLKNYLLYKYKLIDRSKISISKDIDDKNGETKEIGRTKRAFIEDFILFNNPQREKWEKSSEIMSHLQFNPGEVIVDLGSGSGYYSYKFSKIVGNNGKVYSLDTKSGHLDFINDFTKKNSIHNIITVKVGDDQGYEIPEKADYVFLCSLYHIAYGVFSLDERENFINSIVKSLKDNGKLIVVDNGPVDDTTLPYHGPYITKDLIISQLAYYGFELSEYYQTIPQRYVLIFKKK